MTAPYWFKTEGILGQKFGTKAAVKAAVRERVTTMSLDDWRAPDEWMLSLLRHHPEWAEKRGPGVKAIAARLNRGAHFSNVGLWLRRTDGTEVDISWVACIDGAPSTARLVRDAARHAVVDQIEAVRTAQIGGRCSLCGHRLLSDTHVDHAPPFTFEMILQDWLRTVGDVRVADAGLHSTFADDEQRDDWRQWHAWWADLRLIHAHENLGAKR